MRTRPPELSDADVTQVLAGAWRIDATSVEYRPVGFGSHHWAAVAGGRRWFLTVDDLDAKRRSGTEPRAAVFHRLRAALATARDLADAGLTFVVAPIPATDSEIVVRIGDRFAAALYPHVDGRSRHWGDDASPAARSAVLDLVVQIHDRTSPHLMVEDLTIPMLDELLVALDDLDRPWTSGPYAEPARQLLAEHAEGLPRLLEHHRHVADAAVAEPSRFVLTHGEPHPGNTIITADGLALIDWDTALLAPPERDLWTVAGADTSILDAYTTATGRPVLDDVITCYRLNWDLIEIAGYVALLRDEHLESADVAESWRNLQHSLRSADRWPQLLR